MAWSSVAQAGYILAPLGAFGFLRRRALWALLAAGAAGPAMGALFTALRGVWHGGFYPRRSRREAAGRVGAGPAGHDGTLRAGSCLAGRRAGA